MLVSGHKAHFEERQIMTSMFPFAVCRSLELELSCFQASGVTGINLLESYLAVAVPERFTSDTYACVSRILA